MDNVGQLIILLLHKHVMRGLGDILLKFIYIESFKQNSLHKRALYKMALCTQKLTCKIYTRDTKIFINSMKHVFLLKSKAKATFSVNQPQVTYL